VRYRIGRQSEDGVYFAVDSVTGVVTLKHPLDFEKQQIYKVALEAYDAGDPVLFGRAFVTVTVENVNDNDPEISHIRYCLRITLKSVMKSIAIFLVSYTYDGPKTS